VLPAPRPRMISLAPTPSTLPIAGCVVLLLNAVARGVLMLANDRTAAKVILFNWVHPPAIGPSTLLG